MCYSKIMSGGRPTHYDPDYHPDKVYKLALLGMSDAEMADVFNIVESTFNLWKLKHPEFSESINKGKADADSEIAFSLYRKAKGYKYKERTFERMAKDPKKQNTKPKMVLTKIVDKEQPADTGAAFIWLKNRQAKYWRDKIQIDTRTDIHSLGDYEALEEKCKDLARELGIFQDGRDETTPT